MKMRSGVLDVGDTMPTSVKELIVCFLSVFNRQCISKAFLYLFHNDDDSVEGFNEAVLRGLKYGSLSPNGIGAELKPFLKLAMSQGFLAPKDYKSNKFAKRAVELYSNVHHEWQKGGEKQAQQFANDYAMLMFTDSAVVAEEALIAGDIDADEAEKIANDQDDVSYVNDEENDIGSNSSTGGSQESEGDDGQDDVNGGGEEQVGGCGCEFCSEMRGYDDLDLDSIVTDDPLDNLMISGLKAALSKHTDEE